MVNDYENHLIVGEPNQRLIWDCFEELGNFITRPYLESEKVMKDLGIFGDHWTINGN